VATGFSEAPVGLQTHRGAAGCGGKARKALDAILIAQCRYHYESWATLAIGGTATAKITFSCAGTWMLRVYRPGTTDLVDMCFSSWTVKAGW